jgi:cell division protein FtsI (penicillin-binding protein 3)
MPKEAKDFDAKATAKALAPVLGEKPDELEKRLKGANFRWLKRQQPESVRTAVRELHLSGVGIVRESKRVYPKGQLAATLLGFVGVDNQGLAGIEHAFDKVLRGPNQKLRVQVDAYGREILREGGHDPVDTLLADGNRVVLTIDENLQYIAERELARSVAESGALRGAVMMMEPSTGNLVAFAINPTYDPNHFSKYDWNQLKNWAVTDVYEPGSTMKIFTIAAAADMKRIRPDQKFACPPMIKVDGRIVSDHDAPKWNRELTPFEIMEESSNVGTTKISFTMKPSEHRAYLERMGFGRLTGSNISGESTGVLHKLPWRAITQATTSYGQGVSVTPLQILSAAGAIGNGTSAGVPGYKIAGKTGTAQRIRDDGRGYSNDVIASFLGFVPSDKPRYVMLTLLDSPRKVHWAASTAAPLFGRVAAEALRHLAVTPTEPLTKPSVKPKVVL